MANTQNYNLKKLEYTEIADIPAHFNGNMDIIDNVLKVHDDALVTNLQSAKNYTDQQVNTVNQALAAHLAETIHQGKHETLEATSTNDATSVTDAPLKSAGGLAVAKRAYIGDNISISKDILGHHFNISFIASSSPPDNVKLVLTFNIYPARGFLDFKIMGGFNYANRQGYDYKRIYVANTFEVINVESGNFTGGSFLENYQFNGISRNGNTLEISFIKASNARNFISLSGEFFQEAYRVELIDYSIEYLE